MESRSTANEEDLLAIIDALRTQVEELTAQVRLLTAQVAELAAENAQLRGKGGGTPSWVKANRPPRERKPPQRRHQACVRRRETPHEIQEHAVQICPDCGHKLAHGWVHSSRQVIELLPPQVRLVEHRFIRRRCGVCGKRWLPKVADIALGVAGKRRFGAGLQSLVPLLRVAYRLPIALIRRLLAELCGLQISAGQIVALTDGVATAGAHAVQGIHQEIRGSPAVCSDETHWREDGFNGWLWTFATPTLRYFHCDRSRARKVAAAALGNDFAGVVVSDFYAAYNQLPGGKQRCWAHLLRHLHALKELHAEQASVVAWADAVTAVHTRAAAFHEARPKARRQAQAAFERELAQLAGPYRKRAGAPQRVLAARIQRYRHEMFVFVADPRVPATNNHRRTIQGSLGLAERSLRPAVIARKISGGTRSAKGLQHRATLMSLFGTWAAQEKNLLASCKALLLAPTSA